MWRPLSWNNFPKGPIGVSFALAWKPRSCDVSEEDSMRTSRVRAYTVYYDTRNLFSITKSQIYDKNKRDKVKIIILYKSVVESSTFLSENADPKIGHS